MSVFTSLYITAPQTKAKAFALLSQNMPFGFTSLFLNNLLHFLTSICMIAIRGELGTGRYQLVLYWTFVVPQRDWLHASLSSGSGCCECVLSSPLPFYTHPFRMCIGRSGAREIRDDSILSSPSLYQLLGLFRAGCCFLG